MRCVMCGGATTEAKNQTVDLDVGLPGVRIEGISVYTCTNCGETYDELPPMEALLSTITHVIAGREGRLTGTEVRFLRKRIGWSGQDFAEAFCVSATTVSKWENDKIRMDPFKDKVLRDFARRGPVPVNYGHPQLGPVQQAFKIYFPDFVGETTRKASIAPAITDGSSSGRRRGNG